MASWKKILAFDTSPTVNNSFVTVNTNDNVEVVAFGGLEAIPLEGYGTVAERLTEQASNFNFAVHDSSIESGGEHRKLTFDDIAGALTVDLVNSLVDMGQGSISTYTGSTSQNLGDLNDDGAVSVADLLALLAMFNNVVDPVFTDSGVILTNCPSVSPSNGGGGSLFFGDNNNAGQLDQIPVANANFDAGGSISIEVDESTDIITASAETGLDISAFVNQAIALRADGTEFLAVSQVISQPFGLWMKVKTLDSSDTEIQTRWVSIGTFGTAAAGNSQSYYINDDIQAGGQFNFNGVILSDPDIASIEVSFFVDDFLSSIASIEIESLNLDFLISA